ncbi:MAG: NUDIX domain-containing protein [Thaumarchaeota archaeon]|nr:NUDIX domain-containing protein [Nitrososphaerota archaeon]
MHTPAGVLVANEGGRTFLLPGGGARHRESREDAARRELKEETDLDTIESVFLFEYRGRIHKDSRGGFFRDSHKVFCMTTTGVPRPRNEIRYIAYYDGSNVNVSHATKRIIEKYLRLRRGE